MLHRVPLRYGRPGAKDWEDAHESPVLVANPAEVGKTLTHDLYPPCAVLVANQVSA